MVQLYKSDAIVAWNTSWNDFYWKLESDLVSTSVGGTWKSGYRLELEVKATPQKMAKKAISVLLYIHKYMFCLFLKTIL